MVAAFIGLETPSKVYTNEDVQDIIWAVIELKSMATEDSSEHFFKICFLDIYKSINYIVCYNFYQQFKDHFATTGVK